MGTSPVFAKPLLEISLKKTFSADFLTLLVGINFTKVPFLFIFGQLKTLLR
jgi:hypothetical protein